ncbi:hypothetical protein ABTJ92_19495, partial [Acinetobacter baumannii]
MRRRSAQVWLSQLGRIVVALAFNVISYVLMIDVAVAGVSCNQLIGAGMDRSLASFGAAVSAAEGNWGSQNWAN